MSEDRTTEDKQSNMPFDLSGRTAVITGSGSGIGQAIALRLARHGARVEVLDLGVEAAQETVDQIEQAGGMAHATACDVAEQGAVDATVAEILDRRGRIDILVNNAGVAAVGTVEETTVEDLDRVYRVNIKGVYNGLHAVVPHMVEAGGGVVLNMASVASLVALKDRFAYSMSKGAVLTMTYSIAIDYVSQNIRCNCICPARIHTPFVDGYLRDNYPGREAEMFEKLSQYQPIGRMGKPEEVATLALFLCSDEAAFITGAAYPLDGGVTTLIHP
jgi:2-keto-3-deoxy-L-fuconate dehydrogenase